MSEINFDTSVYDERQEEEELKQQLQEAEQERQAAAAVPVPAPTPVAVNTVFARESADPIRVKSVSPGSTILYSTPTVNDPAAVSAPG